MDVEGVEMGEEDTSGDGSEDLFARYRGLPPGWYRDPCDPKMARYWDGTRLGYMRLPVASAEPGASAATKIDPDPSADVPPPGYRSPSDVTICFHWDGTGETRERLANAVAVLPVFSTTTSPLRFVPAKDPAKGRWRFSANCGTQIGLANVADRAAVLSRINRARRSRRQVLFVAAAAAFAAAVASVIATIRANEFVQVLGWAIAAALVLLYAMAVGLRRSVPAHAMSRRIGVGRHVIHHRASNARHARGQRPGSSSRITSKDEHPVIA